MKPLTIVVLGSDQRELCWFRSMTDARRWAKDYSECKLTVVYIHKVPMRPYAEGTLVYGFRNGKEM